MESRGGSASTTSRGLAGLFSDLVRLETRLWELVDGRLRRDHDLALSWFEPMQVIDQVSACRVADIARALSITVGGTSKLVDRIEAAGLCAREANPHDARSSVLALTPAGRRLLAAARASFEDELQTRLADSMSAEHLDAFTATVRHLQHHIGQQGDRTR